MNRATLAKFVYAILIALLARKVYIILYKWPDFKGYYSRLNASELASVDPRVIIDRQVSVQLQSKNDLKDKVGIFILILSAPLNSIERQMTREVLSAVAKRDLKWAFLIGQTRPDVQAQLQIEMEKFGDILQLSIQDGYENLAYKSLAGFAHVAHTYPTLEWIIKMDDDLDVKLDKVLSSLPSSWDDKSLYCHAIMRKMPPVRTMDSVNRKLYVTREAWPWDSYPGYCNGYIYAMRPQAAIKLVSASYFTPFLPLDDIYVTGVLRHRLDMELKLINSNSAILEWMLHCPFLGVFYYALVQDLAYQRGYWPWGMLKELICVTLEHYVQWDGCSAKSS